VKNPDDSESAADATHRTIGVFKFLFSDVMPSFLAHDVRSRLALGIGSGSAQSRFQIVFAQAEKAGSNLSVGGQRVCITHNFSFQKRRGLHWKCKYRRSDTLPAQWSHSTLRAFPALAGSRTRDCANASCERRRRPPFTARIP
jgi:hypothetical protein